MSEPDLGERERGDHVPSVSGARMSQTETVPLAEYLRVIEENEQLRAQIEEMRKALSDWYGA